MKGRRGRPPKPQPPPEPQLPREERRTRLRRLDDLLEALEILNLNDASLLPPAVAQRLTELGVEAPETRTLPDLIEQVWKVQEKFLIHLDIDRRTRSRRRIRPQIEDWLKTALTD
jgi:hypothetical protein